MPKISMNATELKDASVDRVAMVKHGANRVPFRIMKKDTEDMLDLASKDLKGLFKSNDAKAVGPGDVVGVLISKSANPQAVAMNLVKADVFVKGERIVKTEVEGGITLRKASIDAKLPEDAIIMKCSDEVALVVTGVKKDFVGYNFDGTMFSEVMSQGSFYPSVCVANDMFANTVSNIMNAADSPKDAATGIAKAADELGQYLSALAKSLPTKAFKADVEVRREAHKPSESAWALLGAEGQAAWLAANGYQKADMATQGGGGNAAVNARNSGTLMEGTSEWGNGVGFSQPTDFSWATSHATADDDANTVYDSRNPNMANQSTVAGKQPYHKKDGTFDAQAMMSDLMKGIDAKLSGAQDRAARAMKSDIEKLTASVADLSSKVKKADEAVNGVVLADANEDRTSNRRVDESNVRHLPPIDTAVMKIDGHAGSMAASHRNRRAA